VLERVRAFLPYLQQANAQLADTLTEQPDSINIEHVDEGAPHIEMDLACGVVDLKDRSAQAAAERALCSGTAESGTLQDLSNSDGQSDHSSDEDENEDGKDDGTLVPHTEQPSTANRRSHTAVQLCSSKRKAGIVELNEEQLGKIPQKGDVPCQEKFTSKGC
jgi:hypothetical protein